MSIADQDSNQLAKSRVDLHSVGARKLAMQRLWRVEKANSAALSISVSLKRGGSVFLTSVRVERLLDTVEG